MAYFNLPFSVRISNDSPIDGDRYIATNLAARNQLIIDGRAHVGLQVYVLNEKKLYILDSLSPDVWKSSLDSTGGTIDGPLTITAGGLVVEDDVSIHGNLFVDGNSAFGGSVTINGSLFVTNVESIDVSTTFIKLNTGLSGAPPSTLQSGIVVERGTSDPYVFVYDEDDQVFRVGIATLSTSTHYNDSSTQAVATRADNPDANGILHWDGSLYRMDTHPGFTYETSDGIHLPVANVQSYEMTALVWDGLVIGSRDLGTMAFETSTNYYGKTQVNNIALTINSSIDIVNASIGRIDSSLRFLFNWDLSQDASIENLGTNNLSLEASIVRIDASLNDTIEVTDFTYDKVYIDGSFGTRDTSIVYLFGQVSQINASIVRIDASLNDVVDGFSLFLPTASTGYGLAWNNGTHLLDVSIVIPAPNASFNQVYLYIDGSLATRDSSIKQLDSSIIRIDASLNQLYPYIDGSLAARDSSIKQLDASIRRIDASLNDVVDGRTIFLLNASIGTGLSWNTSTHLLDVSVSIPSLNGSVNTFPIFTGGGAIQNSFFKQNGNEFTVADNTSNLVISSGITQGNLILKTTDNGFSDFILDPRDGRITVGLSHTSSNAYFQAGGTQTNVNFIFQPKGNGVTKFNGGIDFNSIAEVSANKVLYYDSSTFHVTFGNAPTAVTTLASLTDVSISSLSDQNLLQYDVASGKWKNINSLDASTYFQKKVVYNSIPSSTTIGAGGPGDVVYDASYLYVCTSTNRWGRVLLDYGF